MADQPFTREEHIAGPVYMDPPAAPAASAPFVPSEHDQFATPTSQSGPGLHGFVSALGAAAVDVMHKIDIPGVADIVPPGVLHLVTDVLDRFEVDAAERAAAEVVEGAVDAGIDAVMVIPDDGYDYVDAELMVADAGDDHAREAQAVASHDHDGAVAAHDVSYDA